MSHDRAITAGKNGLLDDEMVPAEVTQRKGDPLLVSKDERVRPGAIAESLGRLRPTFAPESAAHRHHRTGLPDFRRRRGPS